MRRCAVGVCIAVVLWLAWLPFAPSALAHAALERSDPAPASSLASAPRAVTLWFTEPVVERYSRIAVLDASGNSVAFGNPESIDDSAASALRQPLQQELPDGAYTVVWSVYSSVDAHVSSGVFSFAIGSGTLPTPEQEATLAATAFDAHGVSPPFDVAARWLNLLGATLLFGVLAFVPLVLVPVAGVQLPARGFRRVVAAALLALVAGQLATAIVQVIDVTGGDLPEVLGQPLRTLLSETRFGALWLSRSVLIVALGLLGWAIARRERLVLPRARGAVAVLWGLALLTSSLLLLNTSLGSHAAAAERRAALAIALDCAHLAAAGLWIGGLVCLLIVVPDVSSRRPGEGLSRRALGRFGRIAVFAGIVSILTGLVAARRLVGGWDGLVSTNYGTWFAIKLAIIALVIGIAAWRPLLSRAQARDNDRALVAEAGLGVLIVLAAAAMTAGVPGAIELGSVQPVYGQTILTQDTSVTLRASPGQPGTNEFSIVVAPADTGFRLPPERVALTFAPGEEVLELTTSGLTDPWTFRAAGDQIDAAGDWVVTAAILWPDGTEQPVSFSLHATDEAFYPAGFAPPEDDRSTTALVLGFAWIALGLGLGLASRRVQARAPLLGWVFLSLAALAVLVGAGVVLLANTT
jgi:copper transport protein